VVVSRPNPECEANLLEVVDTGDFLGLAAILNSVIAPVQIKYPRGRQQNRDN
jgi:hypothetical protein